MKLLGFSTVIVTQLQFHYGKCWKVLTFENSRYAVMWYMGDTLKLGSPSLVSILHLRVVVYSSTFRSLGLTSPSTKVEVAYILFKNKVWGDTQKCVFLIASSQWHTVSTFSSPFRRYNKFDLLFRVKTHKSLTIRFGLAHIRIIHLV